MTTLHLLHASMEQGDADQLAADDFDFYLGDVAPDGASFTEVAGRNKLPVLQAAAKRHGYRVAAHGGDTAVVIPAKAKLLDKAAVEVIPSGGSGFGRHTDRPVTSASWVWEGETVTLHVAHWLTHGTYAEAQTGHDTSHKGFSPELLRERFADNRDLSRTMVEEVRKSSRGRHLGFFAGDVNAELLEHRPAHPGDALTVMREGGLLTVWDELKVPPAHRYDTHDNRTIDVLGRCQLDGRVAAKRVQVYNRASIHSDHDGLSVWFEVDQ